MRPTSIEFNRSLNTAECGSQLDAKYLFSKIALREKGSLHWLPKLISSFHERQSPVTMTNEFSLCPKFTNYLPSQTPINKYSLPASNDEDIKYTRDGSKFVRIRLCRKINEQLVEANNVKLITAERQQCRVPSNKEL
jgi:hypothetical protein